MTKVARLGINGFGRIGRQLLRLSFEFDDLDIVAINETTNDILFGECKYTNRPMDVDILYELKRKMGDK